MWRDRTRVTQWIVQRNILDSRELPDEVKNFLVRRNKKALDASAFASSH